VTGHHPFIDVTLATGKKLLDENHPRKEEIAHKSLQLKNSWNQLRKDTVQLLKNLTISISDRQPE